MSFNSKTLLKKLTNQKSKKKLIKLLKHKDNHIKITISITYIHFNRAQLTNQPNKTHIYLTQRTLSIPPKSCTHTSKVMYAYLQSNVSSSKVIYAHLQSHVRISPKLCTQSSKVMYAYFQSYVRIPPKSCTQSSKVMYAYFQSYVRIPPKSCTQSSKVMYAVQKTNNQDQVTTDTKPTHIASTFHFFTFHTLPTKKIKRACNLQRLFRSLPQVVLTISYHDMTEGLLITRGWHQALIVQVCKYRFHLLVLCKVDSSRFQIKARTPHPQNVICHFRTTKQQRQDI